MAEIIIIGGGLAGSEAAWQAAERGIEVKLYEMRPVKETGAHVSGDLAELVCSNSLGSLLVDRASGLLKEEIRRLGSLLLDCAEETALPAGGALAVDREAFSRRVTERIQTHPRIEIIREEMTHIPAQPAILASGPLTSPGLTQAIQEITGHEHLFFYDALAPIVQVETIDRTIAFRASRYGQGEQQEGDYINCPLNKDEYAAFVDALVKAERIPLRWFEQPINQGVTAGAGDFFEGCLPIEVMAARGANSLAFGPMRPVGLKDPRTNRWPHAVVQLRQDNMAGSLYNLVGFQTNLTYAEQKRVLRMVPGLEKAEFVRFGQMHRNTFIASPLVLKPTLQMRQRGDLFFAGQITGVEGYMGNIATGLLAGLNAARLINGQVPLTLPEETVLGALMKYITHSPLKDFQPMKANFGILPRIPTPAKPKRERAMQYVTRALDCLETWAAVNHLELKPKQPVEEG
jgi:methylenetetrahydrofolate--tRNA-(uracil-5-)-methyltransferase